MAICKTPLKNFKIMVKVTGLHLHDKFMDIGVMSEARKNACSSYINVYGNQGNFSYCGYKIHGVTGTVSSTCKTYGFHGHSEVFIYLTGNKLNIFSRDGATNLTADLPHGKYYFYVVLFHLQSSCIVSRLD
jgi:hypothetical protein